VVALHPAVTMVVVLVVAAAETTTRAVVTTRGTKQCPAEAEATVPILGTLKTAAKVPAETPTMCSGTTKCLATKIGTAMLPGNKSCKGKSYFRQWPESHCFLTFLLRSLLWPMLCWIIRHNFHD
jgi:hypothetical protein